MLSTSFAYKNLSISLLIHAHMSFFTNQTSTSSFTSTNFCQISSTNIMHIVELGPWGNGSSKNWSFQFGEGQILKGIKIRHGCVVDAIAFIVVDEITGRVTLNISFGGEGGSCDEIDLDTASGEYIAQISGIGAYFGTHKCITSITIHTNLKAYGPYGVGSIEGQYGSRDVSFFSTPFISNKSVVGFFGGANNYLESIGIFVDTDMELKECERKLKEKEEEIEGLKKEIQKLSKDLAEERKNKEMELKDLNDFSEKKLQDEQNEKKKKKGNIGVKGQV